MRRSERRSEIASTVLTGQEYDDVRRAADRASQPLSAYIRKLILAALVDDALSGSEEHRVSSRLASGQGNAAEDGE